MRRPSQIIRAEADIFDGDCPRHAQQKSRPVYSKNPRGEDGCSYSMLSRTLAIRSATPGDRSHK